METPSRVNLLASPAETSLERKSTRKRKVVTTLDREAETAPQRVRKARPKTGKAFSCDYCKSRSVVNVLRCKPGHKAKSKATPRFAIDPETQKTLTLCNACGLQLDRKNKARPKDPPPSADDKKRYFESAEQFAASLVEGLGEADAEKLTCPVYNTKPCGCMQKFIIGEGESEQSKKRALQLLSILKKAKHLREKKFYNREEVLSKDKGQRKVGLGNGHRKSKEYEDFVLHNRKILRGDLRICERATQRILHYSNNFLHKRLKTDPQNRTQRLKRTKGQAALGKLVKIAELPDQTCCNEHCVLLARTHSLLLTQWRERAISGQLEARKVLAEMLTPSGQSSNCPRFISLVTGSSLSTISRVKDQMWRTGGDREPPQHGLKEYWKSHRRAKGGLLEGLTGVQAMVGQGDSGGGSTPQAPLLSVAQLREKQEQLRRRQQQLEEQQQQLRQEQRSVEHQLVQHQLIQRRQLRQQAALADAQRKATTQQPASIVPKPATRGPPSASLGSSPQILAPARVTSLPNIVLQPVSSGQQGHIYVQSPVCSTNQQARTTLPQPQPQPQLQAQVQTQTQSQSQTQTQSQNDNQQVATLVSVNIEPQQLEAQQQTAPSQGLPQPGPGPGPSGQGQGQLLVSGLDGVDAKLMQHTTNLQQLIVELQNQLVTQQLQQQLLGCSVQSQVPAGPGGGQPPSYSTAMASNHAQLPAFQQQQQQKAKEAPQQTQVIIQTLPGLQPNLLLSSGGGAVVASSSGQTLVSAPAGVSLAQGKGGAGSQLMVPLSLQGGSGGQGGDGVVSMEEVSVQLQEVVLPLGGVEGAGGTTSIMLQPQQLPALLQQAGGQQHHLTALPHLATHTAPPANHSRPSTTTITMEGLCTQQPSPGVVGELGMADAGEGIPTTIPLTGVSVETLLSPEALHIFGAPGPATLNVSLSAARTKQNP